MQGQQTSAYEHHHHEHCWGWNRGISWRAIFAGAFVAIGLGLLLNLISIAWGLSVYATSPQGLSTMATGALVGLFIAIIIIMFLAGFTAGALGGRTRHNAGIVYGFTTWTLAIILTALVTPHLGRYIVNYFNFIQKPAIITQAIEYAEKGAAVAAHVAPEEIGPWEPKVIAQVTTATGTFVLFYLFLAGAIASCIGGLCGAACCPRKEGCEHCAHKESTKT